MKTLTSFDIAKKSDGKQMPYFVGATKMKYIVQFLQMPGLECYSSTHGPFKSWQDAKNFAESITDLEQSEDIIHDYEIHPLSSNKLVNPSKLKFTAGMRSKHENPDLI